MEDSEALDLLVASTEGNVSMAESRESAELATSREWRFETWTPDSLFTPRARAGGGGLVESPLVTWTSGSCGTSPAHLRERRNPRHQAELIQARAKVAELETEVLALQRAAKRARIEEEEREEASESAQRLSRVYKLDQERCQLLQELSEVKKELVLREKELGEKTAKLEEVSEGFSQETSKLQEQLREALSNNQALASKNTNLTTELELLRQQIELETVGVDEVQRSYDRSVESLKARVRELETTESQLHHAQAETQRLERKLRQSKHDAHFIETAMAKVMRYDDLERENRLLREENTTLRGKSGNVDLLRYKVQRLEEVSKLYEEQKTQLVRMELENKELRERLLGDVAGTVEEFVDSNKGTTGRSVPALLYRIQDLQHRELILLTKQGEMETRVKLAEKAAMESRESLRETERRLEHEQAALRSNEERLQRIEKKLMFVTKERDGCVNVLSSYRKDSGVDGVLKDQIAEMERHLKRAEDRIAELERELGQQNTRQPLAAAKPETTPEIIICE